MRLRTENQRLSRAGTCTPAHVLRHELRCARITGARRAHQLCGISQHGVGRRHVARKLLQRTHLQRIEHGHQRRWRGAGRAAQDADFVIVDTPGRDDPLARAAVALADTLVTPMNDSFVDLDLIGQVDAESFKVKKPSFYAELIWDLRKVRAKADGGTVDWVVLRNRLQHLEAHNMRRVGAALAELSKRVGFRVIPGLGERVVYRELFPKGLTLLDLEAMKEGGPIGLSQIAARQELRKMLTGLALPDRTMQAPLAL